MRKRFIIVALAVGIGACKNNNESSMPRNEDVPPQGSPAAGTPVQPVKEVVKDPEFGERITAEGEVDKVYGTQAFTMKAGIFQDDLLVMAPKEVVTAALAASDKVRVTGTVKKMVVSEAEREFAFDFDNAMEVKWEAKPYLVAESLERVND